MSGHSKWSTIKHKKGVADARRGQLFTKLAREIMVAAREGGGEPDTNFRLRLAIDTAKSQNMPKDNIERAVNKGAGIGDGASDALEEITYEAYAPGGAGLLIKTLTDNKNRTASDIRARVTRSGGNLASSGAVSWNFESMGLISMEVSEGDPEDVALEAVDAGAEDVDVVNHTVELTVPFIGFGPLRATVEQMDGVQIERAEIAMMPNSTVPLDRSTAMQTLRLLDALEELDDVQKVFSNADFPDEAARGVRRRVVTSWSLRGCLKRAAGAGKKCHPERNPMSP